MSDSKEPDSKNRWPLKFSHFQFNIIKEQRHPVNDEVCFVRKPIHAHRYDQLSQKWQSRGTGTAEIVYNKQTERARLIFVNNNNTNPILLYCDQSTYAYFSDQNTVYWTDYSTGVRTKWKLNFNGDAHHAQEFAKIFNNYSVPMKYTASIQSIQRKYLANTLNQHKFTDIKFIIGPNKIEFDINRIFLAMISPVFEAMLFGQMKESEPNSEVIIADIDAEAFQCIINFAYCNNPKLTPKIVCLVRSICDRYQIQLLQTICDNYFESCLNGDTFCMLLNEAVKLNSSYCAEACLTFLRCNSNLTKAILDSDAFIEMDLKSMQLFLKSDYLQVSEDWLWTYIITWATYQCRYDEVDVDDVKSDGSEIDEEKLKMLLKSVRNLIRFGLMSGKVFAEKVVPENILDQTELVQILLYYQCKNAGCGKFNINPRMTKSN